MAGQRIVDYYSPSTSEPCSRVATWTVLALTLLLPIAFVSFELLRRHQLSLPDPYNNPYTSWSTGCLLALPVLAVADVIVIAAWRRRIARPVLALSLVLLGLAGLFVVWFVVGLVRFLFP
jgi:hypothetical protein